MNYEEERYAHFSRIRNDPHYRMMGQIQYMQDNALPGMWSIQEPVIRESLPPDYQKLSEDVMQLRTMLIKTKDELQGHLQRSKRKDII